MLKKQKGEVIVVPSRPVIGSKFAGHAEFIDSQNYIRWSVLAPLSESEIKIQKGLLHKIETIIHFKIRSINHMPANLSRVMRGFWR